MKTTQGLTTILFAFILAPTVSFAAPDCLAQLNTIKVPLIFDQQESQSDGGEFYEAKIGNVEYTVHDLGTELIANIGILGNPPQTDVGSMMGETSSSVSLVLNGVTYSISCK